ncbi:hypothetical protein HK105_205120 [Polyrhizophydium stewartii]|uniref:Steroid 5-alpha reductase C-terminal domain-containing protein n=1 Tax=Polyrhizophydium stewartii TaxID=2732419 RepID=A0ABR4N6Y4_9FUNG
MTPLGTSLLVTLAIDFGIQLAAYVVSAALHTERLYDLSGALAYLSCDVVALLWRQSGEGLGALAFRQVAAAIAAFVWSARLGSFLFARVLRVEDKRFDSFKKNPALFAIPFFMQVVWIFLAALPVWVVLANPGSSQPGLAWSDIVGLVIWAAGFVFEVVADNQKSAFKKDHPNDFVTTGVWAYSRYANYFGEVTLWIGMFVLCAAGFVEPWQWVSIVSPVFEFCLIWFVSGVPLAEQNAAKRYGSRADYQDYVARTSKFIPWPPRQRGAVTLPSSSPVPEDNGAA